ncbi:trypsin-like peptidase domain-containing protein [Micromonospora sp. NPDC048909]|uniref:trypsin-like peptidase domain-containing protein n=1 Tax=Micromonospora sp. NPDC048909 TaxID=3155643 RepID=UPI0033E48365
MTAGYGSAGYGSADGAPAEAGAGDAGTAGPPAGRPGPLPPRIEPVAAGVPWPAQPAPGAPSPASGQPGAPSPGFGQPGASPIAGQPGVPAQPTPPGAVPPASAPAPSGWSTTGQPAPSVAGAHPPVVPAARGGWSSPPNTGPWGGAAPASAPPGFAAPGFAGPTSAAPGFAPAPGSAPPGGPATAPAVGPGAPAPFGAPQPTTPLADSGYPAGPGWPAGGPAYPMPPGAVPPVRPRRRRWLTLTAVLVVLVLAGLAGFQAYQIDRLTGRLADTDRQLAQAQGDDGARFDGLEQRTEALEKQAGATFNPEAVASAALPSVFRVRAGQFTGTAFAIGKPAAGGGTNLFTNFHVVEAVWESGGRQVFLERTDQRFPATIVKVDETNDIAHLRTTGKFTGLVAASTAVKSGQQIVVVGAPLGLEDSVTTGVVSAFRKAEPGGPPAIQFDAPINPGNSGGPVINGSKQVVGIATAKARDAEGIGLAVPIKTACDGFKIC